MTPTSEFGKKLWKWIFMRWAEQVHKLKFTLPIIYELGIWEGEIALHARC